MPLWVIGVLLSAIASLLSTIGLGLQKMTHQNQQEKKTRIEKATLRSIRLEEAGAEIMSPPSLRKSLSILDEEAAASAVNHSRDSSAGTVPASTGVSKTTTETSLPAANMVKMPPASQNNNIYNDKSAAVRVDSLTASEEESPSSSENESPVGSGKANNQENEEVGNYYSQPLWILGMSLVILGALLDVASYGFAPQSLLAPMATLTLVFNTLLAPKFLGEQLSNRDIGATGVIVAGTVVVIAFSPHATPEYTVDDLRELYFRLIVLVYGCAIVSVLAFFHSVTQKFDQDPPLDGIWAKIFPLSFPAFAGIIGGQSVLFAKCAVEMIKTSISSDNQFIYPEPYFAILLLAFCLYLQMKYLNAGLARFDALYVIPIYQVFWMISGILGGAIVFNEFVGFSILQWIFFPFGVFIAMMGIYLLTHRQRSMSFYLFFFFFCSTFHSPSCYRAFTLQSSSLVPNRLVFSSLTRAALLILLTVQSMQTFPVDCNEDADTVVGAQSGRASAGSHRRGLSRQGAENILALSAHMKASVFFGAHNSVLVPMGDASNPLAFALPPVDKIKRSFANHFLETHQKLRPSRSCGDLGSIWRMRVEDGTDQGGWLRQSSVPPAISVIREEDREPSRHTAAHETPSDCMISHRSVHPSSSPRSPVDMINPSGFATVSGHLAVGYAAHENVFSSSQPASPVSPFPHRRRHSDISTLLGLHRRITSDPIERHVVLVQSTSPARVLDLEVPTESVYDDDETTYDCDESKRDEDDVRSIHQTGDNTEAQGCVVVDLPRNDDTYADNTVSIMDTMSQVSQLSPSQRAVSPTRSVTPPRDPAPPSSRAGGRSSVISALSRRSNRSLADDHDHDHHEDVVSPDPDRGSISMTVNITTERSNTAIYKYGPESPRSELELGTSQSEKVLDVGKNEVNLQYSPVHADRRFTSQETSNKKQNMDDRSYRRRTDGSNGMFRPASTTLLARALISPRSLPSSTMMASKNDHHSSASGLRVHVPTESIRLPPLKASPSNNVSRTPSLRQLPSPGASNHHPYSDISPR